MVMTRVGVGLAPPLLALWFGWGVWFATVGFLSRDRHDGKRSPGQRLSCRLPEVQAFGVGAPEGLRSRGQVGSDSFWLRTRSGRKLSSRGR